MLRQLFVILFGALILYEIEAHTYSLGSCPIIDPQSEFNMNRMLGVWYAVQKTSTASTCITYNFTKLDEPYEYNLEQTSQHFILGLTPLKHKYHYTGHLSVPDNSVAARMQVKFPLNVIGKASFTIYMTDYENYAGIFTCQGLGIGHRRSATLLSRSRTLDKVYTDKLRTRLASYNIDPFDLSIISQNGCPKSKNGTEGVNINIDDETFSAHSIADVLRTTGEKVGDGVEYLAGGAKKLYSNYASNTNTQASGKIEGAAEFISQTTYDTRSSPEKIQDGRSINEEDSSNWLP